MWFCQPLGQVEPLLLIAALIAAFAPHIYESSTRITSEELVFVSPLSQAIHRTFPFVTLLAILGAILALCYGWFPGNESLATGSLVCVSLALLWTLVILLSTLAELYSYRWRASVFLSQFDKEWQSDLEEVEGDEGVSTTPEDGS